MNGTLVGQLPPKKFPQKALIHSHRFQGTVQNVVHFLGT